MEKAVRRIGVFTSGGDAPGMNASCIGFYLVVCLLYHFFQLSECYFFIHRSILI